jgi:hypothetical protein
LQGDKPDKTAGFHRFNRDLVAGLKGHLEETNQGGRAASESIRKLDKQPSGTQCPAVKEVAGRERKGFERGLMATSNRFQRLRGIAEREEQTFSVSLGRSQKCQQRE